MTRQQKALTDLGAERLRQASVGHSASVEDSRILRAYTLKADGRRIVTWNLGAPSCTRCAEPTAFTRHAI